MGHLNSPLNINPATRTKTEVVYAPNSEVSLGSG